MESKSKMGVAVSTLVVQEACEAIAKKLNQMTLPVPKEDVPALPFTPHEEANFWFFLAAICHQTSPLGLPPLEGTVQGQYRRGWDFLVHSFLGFATENRELLSAHVWSRFEATDMVALFGPRLTEPRERSMLVVDLGRGLIEQGWASIFIANEYCCRYLRDHSPNLLEVLSTFRPFSDPVEKKSVFFLALMRNSKLWDYEDFDRLPAPVDYHEVRGHLRIGTVRIEDPSLMRRVMQEELVTDEDDVAIRTAIRDAIQVIADLTRKPPNDLHYFFWNLFRTYCVRSTPDCGGKTFARLPVDYRNAVLSGGSAECPFCSCCKSAYSKPAVNEHRVLTEYY
jgi:hypothetical protein